MGWFDPPAIAIRKRVPFDALSGFNITEEFALHNLRGQLEQHEPYQLGVVLALWVKAGKMAGEIRLTPRDSKKIQAVYESCMKVLRTDSYTAFCILQELAKQDHMFGTPEEFYQKLSLTVFGIL